MKTRVAMMFGGKSVEHEVSVISGIQAIMNMDTDKYEVIPVYMTKKNEMYVGDDIGNIDAYKNIPELLYSANAFIVFFVITVTTLFPLGPIQLPIASTFGFFE